MFESKGSILFIAGLAFFALAFVSNAWLPIVMYVDLPEKKVEELINHNVRVQIEDLRSRYPTAYAKYVGEIPNPTPGDEASQQQFAATLDRHAAELLRVGRKVYVGEACWHCHSQFVRPVSNEEKRWGPVAKSAEYQNELQRPVLFGTRRVGPDLSREGGRRSNDWQAAHLFEPRLTSPETVMPAYPYFFDGSAEEPNRRGLAVMLYLQWHGSWLPNYFNNYQSPEADSSPGGR